MTVARIWRTSIIAGRKSQYEIFARDISLPMFRQQLGFQGALMARNGIECTVVTLWRERAAIAALEASESYRKTVNHLQASGILTGTATTEVAPVQLAELNLR